MQISLRPEELIVLSHSAVRCLIAKDLLTKEDIIADMMRQRIDADTAFRLNTALDEIPDR